MMWTPASGGTTWWFNQEDRKMAYTADTVLAMSPEVAEGLTWRPHREWQIASLENIDPDAEAAAAPVRFDDLVAKGTQRWQQLTDTMRAGGGALDRDTQAARDWFFREYYTTETRDSGRGNVDMRSNYNARPDSYTGKRAKGEYTGTHDLAEGNMRLDQTYALGGPGEMYYNPRTGNAERMPASEVLFQQWRQAATDQRMATQRLRVKEESVAGEGWKMLREIRVGINSVGRDAVLEPGDPGFLAMLAVPNVTAALYLIRDHGTELGITTITRIDLQKNSHIRIYFG
jgi:hypothetical protein